MPTSTKTKPKPTVAQLHRKLQPIFNRYIRLRDAGKGWAACISCGRNYVIEQLQAGHFLPASHYATRYSEINCWAQCQQCNGYRKSNWPGYSKGLIDRIGVGEYLRLLDMWGQKHIYTVTELETLLSYYKNKVKEMEE